MQRGQIAELSGEVVWHGRSEDAARLIRSVGDHCSCGRGAPPGRVAPLCSAHQMLADQHRLDHLAFARTVADRIVDEEWHGSGSLVDGISQQEWSALIARRTPDNRPVPTTSQAPVRSAHQASGRGAFVASLLALLLVLGAGLPLYPLDAVAGFQIASWQTR